MESSISHRGCLLYQEGWLSNLDKGSLSQIYFFPSLPQDPGLCPVATLRAFKDRTIPYRGEESRVFLSLITPYKAVTYSTIARWLKSLLEAAGIDTSVFNVHSVRGALSSVAANLGITTNGILKAADWSSKSVIQRFYYKSLEVPSYGRAALSSKDKIK